MEFNQPIEHIKWPNKGKYNYCILSKQTDNKKNAKKHVIKQKVTKQRRRK